MSQYDIVDMVACRKLWSLFCVQLTDNQYIFTIKYCTVLRMSIWFYTFLFSSEVLFSFIFLFYFLDFINHTFSLSWLFNADSLVSSLGNLHVIVGISVRIASETYSLHIHSSVLWWKGHEVGSSRI